MYAYQNESYMPSRSERFSRDRDGHFSLGFSEANPKTGSRARSWWGESNTGRKSKMELEKVTRPRKGYDINPHCEQRNGTNVKARLMNSSESYLRWESAEGLTVQLSIVACWQWLLEISNSMTWLAEPVGRVDLLCCAGKSDIKMRLVTIERNVQWNETVRGKRTSNREDDHGGYLKPKGVHMCRDCWIRAFSYFYSLYFNLSIRPNGIFKVVVNFL